MRFARHAQPTTIDPVSLLAVGTVAFDTVHTPFRTAERILGGSATYITLAARLFVDAPRLVAVVGHDFPESCISLLRDRKIDLAGLEVNPTEKTFFWEGRYHYNMNDRDTLDTQLNVLATFDPKLPASYRSTRVVCLGNLQPQVQQQVLDQVESPDLVVCDTMNFWIDSALDELKKTLARIDVLIINDEEARQLADHTNLVVASRIIRAMGPKTLIIKKGEHGAMLFKDDHVFWAPALPLEEIQDPTGAGDTFMGGFAGYLACEGTYTFDSFKRAVLCGTALASFVVGQFGPEALYDLTPEDVQGRLDRLTTLAHVPAVDAIGARMV